MSAFDDFNEASFGEAEDVFGTTSFTIDGQGYIGLVNEFEGDHEVELDGMLVSCNATLVCTKAQFRMLTKPLQKTLQKKTVIMDAVSYIIERAAVDSAGVTLGLRIAR
jgi:hypothetical protein